MFSDLDWDEIRVIGVWPVDGTSNWRHQSGWSIKLSLSLWGDLFPFCPTTTTSTLWRSTSTLSTKWHWPFTNRRDRKIPLSLTRTHEQGFTKRQAILFRAFGFGDDIPPLPNQIQFIFLPFIRAFFSGRLLVMKYEYGRVFQFLLCPVLILILT